MMGDFIQEEHPKFYENWNLTKTAHLCSTTKLPYVKYSGVCSTNGIQLSIILRNIVDRFQRDYVNIPCDSTHIFILIRSDKIV